MAMPDFMFADQEPNEELVPFQNEPPTKPDSLNWEKLTEWLTPQDQVFSIQHYGIPKVDAAAYELEITGLVDHPRTLSIDDLKSLPRHRTVHDARMFRQRIGARIHERGVQRPLDGHAAVANPQGMRH